MKKRKVFSAIFASALSVSCLCGAFSASAENVVSTIDENGVIHSTKGIMQGINFVDQATYSADFSDIFEDRMHNIWSVMAYASTEEEIKAVEENCDGRYFGHYNIVYDKEDGTYRFFMQDIKADTSEGKRSMTKEEAEALAAELLQKKLVSRVTVGRECEIRKSWQMRPVGTVYVYGDHDFTESDFDWLDKDKYTLELNGEEAAIVNQEETTSTTGDDEHWARNYRAMCGAMTEMENVGVWYQPHTYLAIYGYHQHEGDAYDAHETGDVDNNSAVDARDAAAVLTYAAKQGAGMDGTLSGGEAPAEAAAFAAADVNGDGAVNAADAAMILHHSAQEGAGMAPDWA